MGLGIRVSTGLITFMGFTGFIGFIGFRFYTPFRV